MPLACASSTKQSGGLLVKDQNNTFMPKILRRLDDDYDLQAQWISQGRNTTEDT